MHHLNCNLQLYQMNIPVFAPFTVTDVNTQNDANGYYFTTGDTSTQWELNNIIIRAECISLDNTVNNNIVKHLLEGQSLKLVFQCITL